MLNKSLSHVKKTYKISYAAAGTWRQIFLNQSNDVWGSQNKFIHERSSTIAPMYTYTRVRIYTGRGFTVRYVYPWMVGFKFGEFTWNRKLALYKAKQLRKKAKKKK
jgi:ribosomal protein S19